MGGKKAKVWYERIKKDKEGKPVFDSKGPVMEKCSPKPTPRQNRQGK